jgi:HlyD family secretion protein
MKHPLLLLLAALVLVAGGTALYWRIDRPARTDRLILSGDIDVRQVNLSFKVSGRIAGLAVDEGDAVKAGQVLATLDKSYFEDDLRHERAQRDSQAALLARLQNGSRPEEIAQARANVALCRATLENARLTARRQESLAGQGAASRQAADNATAAERQAAAQLASSEQALRLAELGPRAEDIAAARAALDQAEASVVESERRLVDSQLLAPSDGVVLTRAREPGAIVAAGDTVFAVTLSTPVWVRAYVDEADLGRIHPGMVAQVTSDSAPGKVYRARIGFISSLAEFTPKTVETRELRTDLVYRVRLLIDQPGDGLRQGMPVTAAIPIRPAADPES